MLATFDDVIERVHAFVRGSSRGRYTESRPRCGRVTVYSERSQLSVLSVNASVPHEADALLVVGDEASLARRLEELERGHKVLGLPLPCSPELLDRTIESGLHTALDGFRAKIGSQLIDIGLALNAERDPSHLLEMILSEARAMTGADAGSMYLVQGTADERLLRFKYAQNASLQTDFSEFEMPVTARSVVGACVLSQRSINLADMYTQEGASADGVQFRHDRRFDKKTGYQTRSMLTVPMRRPDGDVLGVIQLINSKRGTAPLRAADDFRTRVVAFDDESLRVCSALAAQASVALENAQMYSEIQGMFEGFVRASVVAIEARDPTTSGHSQRVADLSVELVKQVDQTTIGQFSEIQFSSEQVREVEYAALLHDFGKVGVREQVLTKAKKLYESDLSVIGERVERVRVALRVNMLEAQLNRAKSGNFEWADLEVERDQAERRLDHWWALIKHANEPELLEAESSLQMRELARQSFVDGKGGSIQLLGDAEVEALLIRKGSLTSSERIEIQSHVRHTYSFLSKIPWGRKLSGVPEIASKHHEYLDGSGYPNRLSAIDIPIQARMMTIADIFDALTASDRPYKKAVPVERALDILALEARAGKIDANLLDVFTQTKVYKRIGLGLRV